MATDGKYSDISWDQGAVAPASGQQPLPLCVNIPPSSVHRRQFPEHPRFTCSSIHHGGAGRIPSPRLGAFHPTFRVSYDASIHRPWHCFKPQRWGQQAINPRARSFRQSSCWRQIGVSVAPHLAIVCRRRRLELYSLSQTGPVLSKGVNTSCCVVRRGHVIAGSRSPLSSPATTYHIRKCPYMLVYPLSPWIDHMY